MRDGRWGLGGMASGPGRGEVLVPGRERIEAPCTENPSAGRNLFSFGCFLLFIQRVDIK